jgi:hypothetical protein
VTRPARKTRLANKVKLRNTLRKLDAVRRGAVAQIDRGEAAQEALDFLALLAGLKPVFLLGRGVADPPWIRGVLQIAIDQGLYVVEGPYWDAGAADSDLPDWFRDHGASAFRELRAHYICRARATTDQVEAVCAAGAASGPTLAQEARLLGYPECCVADHYRRNLAYQKLWLEMLSDQSGGDEAAMRLKLTNSVSLDPASDDMRRRLEAAMKTHPAPFTSINMCDSCRDDQDSPSRRLSARYRDLAAAIDPGLENELEPLPTLLGRKGL